MAETHILHVEFQTLPFPRPHWGGNFGGQFFNPATTSQALFQLANRQHVDVHLVQRIKGLSAAGSDPESCECDCNPHRFLQKYVDLQIRVDIIVLCENIAVYHYLCQQQSSYACLCLCHIICYVPLLYSWLELIIALMLMLLRRVHDNDQAAPKELIARTGRIDQTV